jgi:hypothetical protein
MKSLLQKIIFSESIKLNLKITIINLNCETPLLQPFIGDSFSFDIVAFLQKMNVDIEELKSK